MIPTKFSIVKNSAFILNNVSYPSPKDIKLSFSDSPLSVWEGTVYFGGILKAAKDLKPGAYPLIVSLEYQSCNNMSCMPPKTIHDTLTVNVVENSAAVSEINHDVFKNIIFIH